MRRPVGVVQRGILARTACSRGLDAVLMGRHGILCRVGFAMRPTLEEMDMASTEWIEASVCRRALVVGDAEGEHGSLGICLVEAGFRVQVAKDGSEALERVVRQPPDLIVAIDERSRMDGIGLVRRLRETSDVPVVIVSAEGSVPECEEAMRVGANRFLQRCCDLDRVGQVARELVQQMSADAARRAGPKLTATHARMMRDRELFELLQRLLLETRGNIAEMARRMGKDRSTVRYHLKRFGMLDDRRPSAPRVDHCDVIGETATRRDHGMQTRDVVAATHKGQGASQVRRQF